jgi:hypothetical protein
MADSFKEFSYPSTQEKNSDLVCISDFKSIIIKSVKEPDELAAVIPYVLHWHQPGTEYGQKQSRFDSTIDLFLKNLGYETIHDQSSDED